MEEIVETKINNSFMLFRANNEENNNVVKQFVSFNGESADAQSS